MDSVAKNLLATWYDVPPLCLPQIADLLVPPEE